MRPRPRLLPLLIALAACRDAGRSAPRTAPPPNAEFIVAAGDSAYWVTSDTGGIRMRGAPIELARLGGRFVEIYVVDDDHSYQSADLIGQSVFRRDLRTGDSTRVFTDSLVPALARAFARTHPDEHPLGPDDETDAEPEIRATATLEFTGTHGPFLSYSLHTDVERADRPFWHSSRHGVLDLRSGKPATLADVAGDDAPRIERQRDIMTRAVLDSVRARAARLLPRFQFDPASFTITTVAGAPAIAYAMPVAGSGETDRTLPLPPVPFRAPAWWSDVAADLPATSADGATDSWQHAGVTVLARYDSSGNGRLVLRDAGAREWSVGAISAPASRIYWLGGQALDAESRHALVRAFNEAATYGAETHIAARTTRSPFLLTSRNR